MEYGSCIVRLKGSVEMEVFKDRVTAPELVLLRAIHGPEGLVRVHAYDNDKRPHATEADRLKRLYGEAVFATAFPGAAPQLPVKFKDVPGLVFQRGRDPAVELVTQDEDEPPPAADESDGVNVSSTEA